MLAAHPPLPSCCLLPSPPVAAEGGAPRSLPALQSTCVALLGMDQDNSVQRTMLSVLRRVAAAAPGSLQPHWKDLVPSICAILQARGASVLSALGWDACACC